MTPWLKVLLKAVTVVPLLIDAGKFAVEKIKLRRKRRLTDAERKQAEEEAKDRLDRILDATRREKWK